MFGARARSATCVSAMRPEDGNVIITALVPAGPGEQPLVTFQEGRIRISMPAWTQEVVIADGDLRMAGIASGPTGVS